MHFKFASILHKHRDFLFLSAKNSPFQMGELELRDIK